MAKVIVYQRVRREVEMEVNDEVLQKAIDGDEEAKTSILDLFDEGVGFEKSDVMTEDELVVLMGDMFVVERM